MDGNGSTFSKWVKSRNRPIVRPLVFPFWSTHFDPNKTAVSSEEEWPVLVVFIDNGRVQDQAKTNSTLYRASYNGMDKSDYSNWMGQNLWDLWYPFPNEGMVILLLYHIENHLHPPKRCVHHCRSDISVDTVRFSRKWNPFDTKEAFSILFTSTFPHLFNLLPRIGWRVTF